MNFKDGQFLKAEEKAKITKTFERFLKSGLKRTIFTKALYGHLSLHFGFIAHYNIDGFYQARFGSFKSAYMTLQSIINASKWSFVDDNTSGNADLNLALKEIAERYNDEIFEKGKEEHLRKLCTERDRIAYELSKLGVK